LCYYVLYEKFIIMDATIINGLITSALFEGRVVLKTQKSRKFYGVLDGEKIKNTIKLLNKIDELENQLNAKCVEKSFIEEELDRSFKLLKLLNLCGEEPASYMFFYQAGMLGKSVSFSIFEKEEDALEKVSSGEKEFYMTKYIKIIKK